MKGIYHAWLAIWHMIVHIGGIDYGLPYGHWGWYNFWSGLGLTLVASSIIWWRGFSCHRAWWCFRHGAHPMQTNGATYKVCWKHHPNIGKKTTWTEKLAHHEHWKRTQKKEGESTT